MRRQLGRGSGAKTGDGVQGEMIYKRMIEAGIYPDISTYNAYAIWLHKITYVLKPLITYSSLLNLHLVFHLKFRFCMSLILYFNELIIKIFISRMLLSMTILYHHTLLQLTTDSFRTSLICVFICGIV
ncbi:hypothetical protein ACJX0J_032492 [Zea mays]